MSERINKSSPTVGIIGGGIMGIHLGYFLSQSGVKVEVFEASSKMGGLAGTFYLEDSTPVDRFHHAILPSDHQLLQLCSDLGLADRLQFRKTRKGYYFEGQIHPMNGLSDYLRFPPLAWPDRIRLVWTFLAARWVRDWKQLEGISVEDWLVRLSGRHNFENVWRPMLDAKFDGGYGDIPAIYMWSRLALPGFIRKFANQDFDVGYLIDGYGSLLNQMARRIEANGGQVHLRHQVNEIVIDRGRASGVRLGSKIQLYDAVVATIQVPIFRRMIPGAASDYHDYLAQTEYLGIIAPIMVLDRPLSGNWTINIASDRFPFTSVIETTTYIDPKFVGGHHLVYLPKYTAPGSLWLKKGDDEIREIWLDGIERMFPGFDRRWIRYFLVHRERFAEPLHGLNRSHLIPSIITPVDRLYLATTAQIYPALTHSESVSRFADQAANIILEGLQSPDHLFVGEIGRVPNTTDRVGI